MKQIKFRAWDEVNKVMLEPQDLTMNFTYWKWLGHKDVPLMQFTGMIDRDGNDIYEGDILAGQGLKNQEVIWDEARGMWSLDGSVPSGQLSHYAVDSRIIGNVCENPELLTKNDHE